MNIRLTETISDAVGHPHGKPWDAGAVTDQAGVRWRLLFDEKTNRPEAPLDRFDGQRAEIEGRSMDTDEPTLLVRSLRIVI